jgi:hypothetical protein
MDDRDDLGLRDMVCPDKPRRERLPNKRQGANMGIFSGLAKTGLAKKAIDEARKPENQRKMKDVVAKVRDRAGKGRAH